MIRDSMAIVRQKTFNKSHEVIVKWLHKEEGISEYSTNYQVLCLKVENGVPVYYGLEFLIKASHRNYCQLGVSWVQI